jgi:hypothetical protein
MAAMIDRCVSGREATAVAIEVKAMVDVEREVGRLTHRVAAHAVR